MNKIDKNWEKEFSIFERDLDVSEKQGISIENLDSSLLEKNWNLPKKNTEEIKTTPNQEICLTEVVPEELLAVEPSPVIHEELSRHEHPPLNSDDMTKLATRLEQGILATIPLRDQTLRMATNYNAIRLPKGLRTTACILDDLVDVLIATKTIINLYLQLGVEQLYQGIEDYGLKTSTTNTVNTLMNHIPSIQEGLNDVERSMDEGYDRPSANLRMRIVKGQSKIILNYFYKQAKALAQTIEAFPLENGVLKVLCLLEEKGDQAMMNSIDRTMEIAEHVQVPVADAPAMLEAVRNNDQKAVDAIIARMIQKRV